MLHDRLHPDDGGAPAVGTDHDYLAALNAEQRRAVEHATDGIEVASPLLIIAGAGSGKTNTLAHRVAHLVCRGADPRRIMLLTFSRRAAAEMERRAGRILQRVLRSNQTPRLLWSGTFHSVGARLLREYARRIGLAESFTILDRGDAEDLIAIVRHELGLDAAKARFPGKATCLAVYSRVVNSSGALAEVLARAFPWCAHWEAELKRLFAAYTVAKQAQNVLDYDDLLLYWWHALADAALAREVGERFDHVLVDEYQDTNRVQAEILLALKPDGRGITVVGDDAQSIYSFRAATVRNILDFPAQFPARAHVATLERNYRSTQPILDAANAVIGLATERYAKELRGVRAGGAKPRLVAVRDEVDQACCVAERVLAHREAGVGLKAQAVLFRSSHHSAQLEVELARRDIPFVKYGGLRFLEAAHVKDVLAMLRWAENPRGRLAGFRAARLVPGIGPATAARLLDAMDASADPIAALRGFAVAPVAADDWDRLVSLVVSLHRSESGWPAELEQVSRWYEPHLERIYEDAFVRRRDLVQLAQIARTYASRERFLTELALDPPAATSDEADAPGRDDDYLVLSTIHSAKGQEWKAVHVLNVVDGCIPSDMSTETSEEIEEERRLLYVAMTRARDHLDLVVPQRFYVHGQAAQGDRHVYASRTRFIPDQIADRFEFAVWAEAVETDDASRVAEPEPSIDLAARVRARWS
ncbi:MAG TPA: ATP-dependent helicase [Casimicrobiaceae bacterium]|nr:ATP-dependent helicase [Casimicrobiaceae bacterium]